MSAQLQDKDKPSLQKFINQLPIIDVSHLEFNQKIDKDKNPDYVGCQDIAFVFKARWQLEAIEGIKDQIKNTFVIRCCEHDITKQVFDSVLARSGAAYGFMQKKSKRHEYLVMPLGYCKQMNALLLEGDHSISLYDVLKVFRMIGIEKVPQHILIRILQDVVGALQVFQGEERLPNVPGRYWHNNGYIKRDIRTELLFFKKGKTQSLEELIKLVKNIKKWGHYTTDQEDRLNLLTFKALHELVEMEQDISVPFVKMGDMGMGRYLSNTKSGGKQEDVWVPPELNGLRDADLIDQLDTEKSDVYRFAILAFEVWTSASWEQVAPAFQNEVVKRFHPTENCSVAFRKLFCRLLEPENTPKSIYEMIIKNWNQNPQKRQNLEEIDKALRESYCIAKFGKDYKQNPQYLERKKFKNDCWKKQDSELSLRLHEREPKEKPVAAPENQNAQPILHQMKSVEEKPKIRFVIVANEDRQARQEASLSNQSEGSEQIIRIHH